jgi:hypothetical protein
MTVWAVVARELQAGWVGMTVWAGPASRASATWPCGSMFTNMMSCPSNMYSVACWWDAMWLMSQRFISTSMQGTASISVEVMRLG